MPDDIAVDAESATTAPAPAPSPAPAPVAPSVPDEPVPIGDPLPSAEEWSRVRAELAAERAAHDAGIEALRRDWGDDFDANVGLAKRLAGEVAGPELIEAIDRAGLGDDPLLLRAVADVARRLYGRAQVPSGAGGRETERIRSRLDELHALQFHDDPRERESYRSPRVQGELERLYATLYGTTPVVGRDLRVA